MALQSVDLTMYTQPTDHEPLLLDEVVGWLGAAGTYWVSSAGGGAPHPRPVWGVWVDDRLLLSLGSPVLRAALAADPHVVVHPDSGTEVVIVSGTAAPDASPAVVARFVEAYDAKYDWRYDADTYGPPTVVEPREILAWQAAGPAGRDGFRRSGKWVATS